MDRLINKYLRIIPESEKKKLAEFIENYIDNNKDYNLDEIINKMIEDNRPIIERYIIEEEEIAKESFSKFFESIELELNYLFQVVDKIYKTKNNIYEMDQSFFKSINGELTTIEKSIKEQKIKKKLGKNIKIINEDFSSIDNMEPASSILYDNETVAVIEDRKLKMESDVELLNITNLGNSSAKVELIDFIGSPINEDTLQNIVDGSENTSCNLGIKTEHKINIGMEDFKETGAMVKLRITLSKMKYISEIMINPQTIFPIEILSIKIEGEEKMEQPVRTRDRAVINFSPTLSDEIIIILRQNAYIVIEDAYDNKELLANELLIDSLKLSSEELYDKYLGILSEDDQSWAQKILGGINQ